MQKLRWLHGRGTISFPLLQIDAKNDWVCCGNAGGSACFPGDGHGKTGGKTGGKKSYLIFSLKL
jgi:hypothetical protein